MASILEAKLVASDVCLYKLLITTLGTASRFSSMTTRVFSSDSSRTAVISERIRSFASCAMRSTSVARLTLNGISVMTILLLPPLSSSTSSDPRTFTEPLPVLKYCSIGAKPQTEQPVGKSGPLTYFISCLSVISGLSICAHIPSIISPRL